MTLVHGHYLDDLRSLRDGQELMRAVFHASRDAMAITDDSGCWLEVNTALATLFGARPQQLVGRRLQEFFAPGQALSTGPTPEPDDARVALVRPDGATRIVELIEVADIRNDRNLVTLREVTDEQPVAREAGGGNQLERRRRQAERLESLGRLAGGVAHDFNNLLTAIIGYADLLLADLPPAAADCRQDAKEIRSAADRAVRLTAQLLAFSRRPPVEAAPVDVPGAVDEIVPLLRRLIGADIDLRVTHHVAAAWARIDPGQFEQVVMNLVLNGRDAMPRGGLLTIETGEVELDPAFAALHPGAVPGRHVRLAVSDTGIGMDPATMERVFEPFFSTRDGGTGLGLSTVYGVVTGAGGHVWAYSEVGRGSEFKVYLPVAAAPAPAAIVEAPAAVNGTETVLLIEDDTAVRVLARSVLTRAGYRVLAAADPGEALALALDRPTAIDLLITDLVLPGMSGPQLARQLAAIGCARRVLYISGYSETASRERGLIDADVAFLPKPFTAYGLARRVRDVLDTPAA